jgi:hypothetical protein
MNIKNWKDLYRSLTIERPSEGVLPKPTEIAIKSFEKKQKLKLPSTYRSFIKVFGPGELAWEYRLTAPGYSEQRWTIDLEKFNAQVKGQLTKHALKKYSSPERALRMLYFCRSSAGDLIGWDVTEISNPKTHDYSIYVLSGPGSPKKLVDSFSEFINDVCLGKDNVNISGSFDPASDLSGNAAER